MNASGGLLDLTGSNTYGGATTITAGTLELGNGGSGGSLSPSSTISLGTSGTGGNLTFNRNTALVQGTDFTATAISGKGSVTVAGAGATLSSANTYQGGTTVTSGATLLVANGSNGSATGSGQFNLNAGATLAGNGTINSSGFNLNGTVLVGQNSAGDHNTRRNR